MDAENKMTDAEYLEMLRLLRRYASTELDQFDLWKFDTEFGTVYVDVSRKPAWEGYEDAYTDINHLLEDGS